MEKMQCKEKKKYEGRQGVYGEGTIIEKENEKNMNKK